MVKKSKEHPEVKTISEKELWSLLDRAKEGPLTEEDCELLKNLIETVVLMGSLLKETDAKLKQVLRQMFGIKSEKSSKIFQQDQQGEGSASEVEERIESSEKSDSQEQSGETKKRKGHGRNGAEKYTGAEIIRVEHSELKSGDECPECFRGKVYKEKKPGVFIHVEGRAPISATIYETEKLRCNLCGEIFEAELPVDLPAKKHYDETAKSMMGILRYGYGMPLNRLEDLQEELGIPLPATTAWDKTKEAAEEIEPVHQELVRLAAQGKVIHNDDTKMKILETKKEIERELEQANGQKTRSGICTTGIVSNVDDKQIALFFTGRKHAGENFKELLEERDSGLSPPLQMCDAKNGNSPGSTSAITCNCNAHARRYFVDVSESFPDQCAYVVLDVYREIYKNDAYTKEQEMSPEQRLQYHQQHSAPIMEQFHLWLKQQFDQKLVEENSGLGKAISYTLNHWPKLTRFLNTPGAPLDNNICEQALKMAICHRKNSLFYKTSNGARVGDIFMSLIHTCFYSKVNPFHYLTQLQRYCAEVAKEPSKWLPWNYSLQLQPVSS